MKRVTMASGILLGLGFFLTAHSSSLMMLWLSAGVLVGLADGAGYLLTLSNCVKWFPERKGLISAFSIGSYGLGSLGFKFIDSHLLATVGLEKTFVIWGAIVLVMIVFGATLMKDAPNHPAATAANGVVENDFTLAESMRKTAVLDAGGDVPDGLHERSVRNWRSERYCPGNGPPGCRHGGQRGNGYLDCEPQRSPGVRYPV
ncbi:resistance protein [Klebsiella pneumoniae]|uniref:Resistance protein n=1 Tax=Klebsiella pneumoniae TaxID=573 RepID=A0A2X3CAY0_KLEPN|nr:resistance protein [Klebsiella pneumoniae]